MVFQKKLEDTQWVMKMLGKIARRSKEEFFQAQQLFSERFYAHTPPTPFVIVCNIRTGSTMLQNLVNSHPNARCFFELFHRHKQSIPFGLPGYLKRSNDPTIVRFRNEDPVGFLEQFIFDKQPRPIQAVGFKLLYSQARRGQQWWESPEYAYWWKEVDIEPKWEGDSRYLWDYLAERKVHIIHLTRDNLLESKISAYIAQQTGQWGIGATGGFRDAPFTEKIHIDVNEFLLDLEGEEKFRKEVRERFSKNPFLETTYEQLTQGKEQEYSRILQFLGLLPKTLSTPTRKLRDYQIQDVVENFEELKAHLQGGPYAFMLEASDE